MYVPSIFSPLEVSRPRSEKKSTQYIVNMNISSFFVSTAQKMLFGMECREMGKKKYKKQHSRLRAQHTKKTNNALGLRINNKNSFGIKRLCSNSPLTVERPAWPRKDSSNFSSIDIKCIGLNMRSLTIMVSNFFKSSQLKVNFKNTLKDLSELPLRTKMSVRYERTAKNKEILWR